MIQRVITAVTGFVMTTSFVVMVCQNTTPDSQFWTRHTNALPIAIGIGVVVALLAFFSDKIPRQINS